MPKICGIYLEPQAKVTIHLVIITLYYLYNINYYFSLPKMTSLKSLKVSSYTLIPFDMILPVEQLR